MSFQYCLFDTPVGRCGIAWSDRGIAAVQLPEHDDAATAARMLRRCAHAVHAPPPPEVRDAIAAIAALLAGTRDDLRHLPLDLEGITPFDRRVYALARTIPPGETLTYGEMAQRLGARGLARAVGRSLGRNPFAPVVPCHRVLAAGGRMGGFSAHGGVTLKQRMLRAEGATSVAQAPLFDETDAAPAGNR